MRVSGHRCYGDSSSSTSESTTGIHYTSHPTIQRALKHNLAFMMPSRTCYTTMSQDSKNYGPFPNWNTQLLHLHDALDTSLDMSGMSLYLPLNLEASRKYFILPKQPAEWFSAVIDFVLFHTIFIAMTGFWFLHTSPSIACHLQRSVTFHQAQLDWTSVDRSL